MTDTSAAPSGAFLPPARPDISVIDAIELAGEYYDPALKVWLLGRRGYYRDTMGKPQANDRNIYDDAIAIVTPEQVISFNANTDPSKQGGHIGCLAPGKYLYKIGQHHHDTPQAYKALVQAGPVTLKRDDGVIETGWFGVNHHRGGHATSTGSLACQTIYDAQYDEYIGRVGNLIGQGTITYILTERANG